MLRALMTAALVAIVAIGMAGPAGACGSVRDWTANYLAPGQSDEGRVSALAELSGCGGYHGKSSDLLLLPVLEDAVARGYDAALVQAAFDRLEAAARALKDNAQGDGAAETLQAELDKALADNAALAKVTESASGRIDAAVVRLRSVLDDG